MDQNVQPVQRREEHQSSSTNCPNINITAQNGGQVSAVMLIQSTFHGDVNITQNFSSTGSQISVSQISAEYREFVVDKCKTVEEYNSSPGEYMLLDERYVDLLMIQKHREVKERKQELCSKGQRLQKVLNSRNRDEYQRTSINQLFSPDDRGHVQKAVLLQANSGNGKSFTAQKIMLDWASGSLYADKFDFIFHLKCKELNVTEDTSLEELLSYSIKPEQITEVLHSPGRLLFLIDGFDELKLQKTTHTSLTDPRKTAPPKDILIALLQGKMLPKCFLLVTTRSTATPALSKLLKTPYRFIEILGFSEKGVEEYFQRFFKEEGGAFSRKAYECVKANQNLFTACVIPVICWIICTYIKERFQEGADLTSGLETTTSIYVNFVSTLLENHCQDLSHPVRDLLKSLGQLAERGMLQHKVLFDETVEADVNVPPLPMFLCKTPFRKIVHSRPKFMVGFIHLSFQEFFTALYYVMLDEDESLRNIRNLLGITDHDKCDETSAHGRNLNLQCSPVIRFLCGLCNETVSTAYIMETETETYNLSVSPSIQTLLKKWILQVIADSGQIRDGKVGEGIVFILHCLYELHEEDFVRKAMEAWEEIHLGITFLSTTDCWVLFYCLQCCEQIKNLNLGRCLGITADKLRMLQPALRRCEKLCLCLEELTDADANDLVLALGEGNSLRYFRQHKGALSEQSVQSVLITLSKQKTVGVVGFPVKSISTETAVLLINITQNTEVTNLNIRVDEASDDNVCSYLGVSNSAGEFRVWISTYSTQIEPSLSKVRFTCPHAVISSINWRGFLQTFHRINSSTGIYEGLEEDLSSLLGVLKSVSGLKEVELGFFSLTERWASWVLSIIQVCTTIHKLKASISKEHSNDECVCSSLCMSKDDGDFTLTVYGISRPQTDPSISKIRLTYPHSDTSRTNWRGFLQTLHKINSSAEAYEGLEEDLSSLLGVLESMSGLKEVELGFFSLTETWASWVLSIIQACPTLHELSVDTDMWNGLILEEGVRLLEKSQKRPDCTLTVSGMRCHKPSDQCTVDPEKKFCPPLMMDLSCNQNVKLQF
ncbi:NACHT, LRR and PYD domains-containing protein 1 homolog [Colossoma macropomum]|uniref:NACHT, LRR and PYD domains-containing protein 1 homolog n=1 Tax=Colossoma macropomum TaxID=42526 RepID=UPI0018640B0A|nr:NACHT, LRR and PYD domains-containing protein 1 homolog [Colossoma macropomum]